MRSAIAAVIGHVDHGKTTLVRMLTGTDTDRLAEEKRRGISIVLGFARLLDPAAGDPGTAIDLVDVPGHERFVREAVAGAGGLDFVLLVVAANEGVREQTREHLAIAGLLGVSRCVLAVTKADLVDVDVAELAELEARDAAERAGLACEAAVSTATGGRGLPALRHALFEAARASPGRGNDGMPFLPVDRTFSVAGHGTVVTGTLRGGVLSVGDAVAVLPGGIPARIRGLQVHNRPVARAEPGGRVAVNLRGLDREAVPAGAALAPPDALAASAWLGTWLRATGRDLRTGTRLRLLIGTAERDVRLRLLDRELLRDGEEGPAQLRLSEPVAVPARMRFVLRLVSPPATVGGGTVIEPEGTRARRHDPAVRERFERRARGSRAAVLFDAVERAGRGGVALPALARLVGTGAAQAVAALAGAEVVVTPDGIAVGSRALAEVEAGVQLVLRRAPDGLPREMLARMVPRTGSAVLDEAVRRLSARGALLRRDGAFVVPDAARDRLRDSRDARDLAALAELLRAGELSPPDLPGDPRTRRLLDALLRQGTAVRTTDRVQKRDIVFHADAVAQARRRLASALHGRDGLSVSAAGEALGISRKYSVPLLEHLDAIGFTVRHGDRRRLASS